MRWRAWYTEGREFSGDDMNWTALPSVGALVVIEYRDTGRTVYSGGDWYWLDEGRIHYAPSGPWGTWKPRPDLRCVSCAKQGVGVSDDEFRAVLGRALAA